MILQNQWGCPPRTWYRKMHRKMSLLFMHAATFLTTSMWQCSKPWVLKFSNQPNKMSSHTLCSILRAFSNFQADFFPFRREVDLQILDGRQWLILQPLQLVCLHFKRSGLHVLFQGGNMCLNHFFTWVLCKQFSNQISTIKVGFVNNWIDQTYLPQNSK